MNARDGRPSFTHKYALTESGGTIARPEVREMLASLARNRVRLGGKHQTGCSRDVGRSDQTKFPVRLGGAITRPGAQRYVRQSSQNYVLIKSGGAVAEPNTREVSPSPPRNISWLNRVAQAPT